MVCGGPLYGGYGWRRYVTLEPPFFESLSLVIDSSQGLRQFKWHAWRPGITVALRRGSQAGGAPAVQPQAGLVATVQQGKGVKTGGGCCTAIMYTVAGREARGQQTRPALKIGSAGGNQRGINQSADDGHGP